MLCMNGKWSISLYKYILSNVKSFFKNKFTLIYLGHNLSWILMNFPYPRIHIVLYLCCIKYVGFIDQLLPNHLLYSGTYTALHHFKQVNGGMCKDNSHPNYKLRTVKIRCIFIFNCLCMFSVQKSEVEQQLVHPA